MDYRFMFRQLNRCRWYFVLSRHVVILNIHVNIQLIKNPQPAMSMQQIMRWGHDFLRIRGGMFNLEPFGENPFVKIKHPKMYAHSLIHSHFHIPSHFGERRDIF